MEDVSLEIIERLKARDEKAFDIIYDKYYRLVYYVAYEILNDASGSEDILQETFIRLMDNIEDYEDEGNFKNYLTRIAKNLALNELKRKKRVQLIEYDEDIDSNQANDIDIVFTIDKCLSKEEAIIVKNKVLYDYSFKEIANQLHWSIGKTQSQYYLALKKLKKHFGEKEEK